MVVMQLVFWVKTEEILKQSDEISWVAYTPDCPPQGTFGISIKDTDSLEQMTLPWIFVSELRGRAGDLASAGSLAGAYGFL